MTFSIGQKVRTPIGRIATIVKGPYQYYGRETYDIVQRTDLGKPGMYSNRYAADQLAPMGDDK